MQMVALWKKNKVLFLFILAIIFLFPTAISKEAITYTHLICVALGIDKLDDGYEVSLQVIVPKQSNAFNESLKLIKAKADTVNEAVNTISYQSGKEVAFAQCEFIVYNEEMAKESIILPVDYFVRTHNLNLNCVLVCTDKSASKILEINENLGQSYSFDLNKILDYNERFLLSKDTNIEQAYRSYLSPNSSFAISLITATDDDSKGLESGSGGSGDSSSGGGSGESSGGGSSGGGGGGSSSSQNGGGSSGQSSQKEENVLTNDREIALIKQGKYIGRINDKEVDGIEYFNPKAKGLYIYVKDFTDELYKNADITVEVTGKKCLYNYSIEGDKLKINADALLYVKMNDIKQDDNFGKFLVADKNYFTYALYKQITKQETERFERCLNKLKEYNMDYLEIYEKFNRWNHNAFQKYLKTLENKDDYFKNVEISLNFQFISK